MLEAFTWFNESDSDNNLTLTTEEVSDALGLNSCGGKIIMQMVDGYFGHQYRDGIMALNEWNVLMMVLSSDVDV